MDEYLDKFNKIYEEKCNNKFLPSILPPASRIIVIGDIHGDMDKLLKCLRIPKLIDNDNNWIGGKTVVVQIGDQIDSCRFNKISNCNQPNNSLLDIADDVKILYYLTELHNQASQHGGAVYSLMGNHEFMNVDGDMRFVSHSNIREFDNLLKNVAKQPNLLKICANPDISIPKGDIIRYCAGYFARIIEENGGEVVYTGKPKNVIYQHIFKRLATVPKHRILMIGDTFETDILGAQSARIDSALVLTGNTRKYHSIYESLDDKVSVLGEKAEELKIYPTFITELT